MMGNYHVRFDRGLRGKVSQDNSPLCLPNFYGFCPICAAKKTEGLRQNLEELVNLTAILTWIHSESVGVIGIIDWAKARRSDSKASVYSKENALLIN